MAQCRTNRIGTIFSRVTSLLRGGGIEKDNVPLWYDIYKAFPPKYEPNFNRRPSQKQILNILYKEDETRAKFQKAMEYVRAVDLKSEQSTQSQLFLSIHNALLKNGMNEEEAYSQALANYKSLYNIGKHKSNASANTSSE